MYGVPQGSILGPLLWNVGYNSVLRGALLRSMGIVCYADDILMVARGNDAAALATSGTALLVHRIEELGLRVALEKTEALWFHRPRRRPPADRSRLIINGVEVGASMKYLGLILNNR